MGRGDGPKKKGKAASNDYSDGGSKAESAKPVYDPHHTDCFFLILFALFWVGMIVIGIYAFTHGDANRLIHGVDMYGNLCGVKNYVGSTLKLDLTSKSKLLFPNPFDTDISYCVDTCPCQSGCPVVNPLSPSYANAFCPYDVDGVTPTASSILDFKPFGGKCYYWFTTREVFNRCLPYGATLPVVGNVTFPDGTKDLNSTASPGSSKIDALRDTSSKVLGDVNQAKYWILMCVGIAIGSAFIWMVLMTLAAGVVVWCTILLVFTLLLLITIFLAIGWYKYERLYNYMISQNRYYDFSDYERAGKTTLFALFCVFGVLTLIMLLLICFFARRIKIAVALIKEASRAVRSMLSVLVFPIIPAIMLGLFYAWFIAGWLFLGTAGTYYTQTNGTTVYVVDQTLQGMQIYWIFGLFWISTFLVGIGQFTLGKAFSSWYYAPKDSDGKLTEGLGFVVTRSFRQTIWYHAGSVAFGSFIIAVVKFIRFIVNQLEKRMKATKMNNRCIQCIFYFIKCCLSYVERFLKFISLNAYIIIGLNGNISFCGAAQKAFSLLFSNILLLGAVTVVSDFLLFLGKLFIMSIATAVAVWVMKEDSNLNYWAIPVIIVAILSYFIAAAFFAVYKMAISTLFICFCYDVDAKIEGPHTSPRLNDFMEKKKLLAPAPDKK